MMSRRRRRRSPWRQAAQAMKPNRVAARFISGGKHQTFTSIVRSPFRTKTITNKNNRRQQYQADKRRERQRVQREKRRAAREAVAQKRAYARRAAELKKTAPKPPPKPRAKPVPIAVNPRTGRPITLTEAMRSLKEAQQRAERLAAGLPGDPPPTRPRAPRAQTKKTATKKTAAARSAPRKKAAAKKNVPPAPPPPPTSPGKNLRGLYLAVTCVCQGTGRIYTVKNGMVTGSTSCPEHGRRARGSRRTFSRRAMTDSGLPGLAGWLDAKYRQPRGNLDRKQERAVRQSGRARYAGPVVACEACDEGVVNRELTEKLRMDFISDTIAKYEGQERRVPSSRTLDAMASRTYPYDRCRVCNGLAVISDTHAGTWRDQTNLRKQHPLTARERATGKIPPGRRR